MGIMAYTTAAVIHQGRVITDNTAQSCQTRQDSRHIVRNIMFGFAQYDLDHAVTTGDYLEIGKILVYVNDKYAEVQCS